MNFESESKHLCASSANCHIVEIQREIRTNVFLAPTRRGEPQNFAGFGAAPGGISPTTPTGPPEPGPGARDGGRPWRERPGKPERGHRHI